MNMMDVNPSMKYIVLGDRGIDDTRLSGVAWIWKD